MANTQSYKSNLTANEDRVLGTLNPTNDDTVVGIIKASHAGTLFIEQSIDGTNWDFSTSITVVAATGGSFKQELFAPYVRLRYVNGATTTTYFRFRSRTTAAGHR